MSRRTLDRRQTWFFLSFFFLTVPKTFRLEKNVVLALSGYLGKNKSQEHLMVMPCFDSHTVRRGAWSRMLNVRYMILLN
jgi:hypothetical protein